MTSQAEHPYTSFVAQALAASRAQRAWTPDDGPLPALYLSHGAPPLLETRQWMDELLALGAGHAQAQGHPDRQRPLGDAPRSA